MSDIFQEVDEEVRRDRLKEYWRAYGSYMIATAVLIILITSGRVIWKDYTESRAARESESFASALKLEEAGSVTSAIVAYNDIADTAVTGVATLARLRAAAALLSAGREDEAIAAYDALANNNSADREIRELAALNAASLLMGRDPTDDVRARLEKLAVDDGAWKYSAKELLGVMSYRQG
ncbi:MAG: tetratricopeptide repeat protein, partial [Sphingomonadales bacterium]|nr:tetratricopeptide repeat protein [Sphingomonadales bacterium]